MLYTTWPSQAKHALNKLVGTGSSMEVAAFICETSLPREVKSSVEQFERGVPEKEKVLKAMSTEVLLILLQETKSRNLLQTTAAVFGKNCYLLKEMKQSPYLFSDSSN